LSVAPKWRAVLHRLIKNCRHRGSDARDAPLLGEWEGAAGDGEVVIGAEQGDQAKDEAAEGLENAQAIQAGPGEIEVW
jgi:hypothetical protein